MDGINTNYYHKAQTAEDNKQYDGTNINIEKKLPKQNSDYQTKLEKNIGIKNYKEEDLLEATNIANKLLFKNNTHLQFRIHDKTKEVMVKIVNDETGEVVREIPPEKMLDMVAKLWEVAGILVDERR